mmetsp:Transcript_139397/g.445820  ORF Transcript_139397/g.445820 Transcript_139397/m.445820 type:complete len:481 (+) Transcript_139397:1527-2969(+)
MHGSSGVGSGRRNALLPGGAVGSGLCRKLLDEGLPHIHDPMHLTRRNSVSGTQRAELVRSGGRPFEDLTARVALEGTGEAAGGQGMQAATDMFGPLRQRHLGSLPPSADDGAHPQSGGGARRWRGGAQEGERQQPAAFAEGGRLGRRRLRASDASLVHEALYGGLALHALLRAVPRQQLHTATRRALSGHGGHRERGPIHLDVPDQRLQRVVELTHQRALQRGDAPALGDEGRAALAGLRGALDELRGGAPADAYDRESAVFLAMLCDVLGRCIGVHRVSVGNEQHAKLNAGFSLKTLENRSQHVTDLLLLILWLNRGGGAEVRGADRGRGSGGSSCSSNTRSFDVPLSGDERRLIQFPARGGKQSRACTIGARAQTQQVDTTAVGHTPQECVGSCLQAAEPSSTHGGRSIQDQDELIFTMRRRHSRRRPHHSSRQQACGRMPLQDEFGCESRTSLFKGKRRTTLRCGRLDVDEHILKTL